MFSSVHHKIFVHREHVTSSLEQQLGVDVYGRCGNLSCRAATRDNHAPDNECYSMLDRGYKFYLAFENSICKVALTLYLNKSKNTDDWSQKC